MVRDSLGVSIIENAAPARTGAWWRVSGEPTLTIGARGGDPASLFHQVAGVVRLGNGSIVVADGATGELRFFDQAGRHLLSTGGSGGGPGEFRRMGSIVEVRADSVVIFDHFAARISVFDPEGAFARAIPLGQLFGVTLGWVAFGSAPRGGLLLRGMTPTPPPGFGPAPADAPILLADPESGELTRLLEVPVAVVATGPQGQPRPVFPATVAPAPVVTERGFWVAVPAAADLLRVRWDGSVDRIARFLDPGTDLGAGDVVRILSWQRGLTAGLPAEALAMLAEPAVLPRLPTFAALIVDSEDHLWVQEVRPDRNPEEWEFAAPRGSHRWRVVTPDGVWLGSLDLPDGFRPYSIGADYVLGVWMDDDGVEFIHLYALARN